MTQTLKHTDAHIKSAVTDELDWLPSVNSANIGVAVNDGAVTLTGEVGTYQEKLLATRAAQRVRGVTAIAQEINVHSGWSEVTDTQIAEHAGHALEHSIDVPDSISASVHDRVITLSGPVQWNFQRTAAEKAVQHLKGVTNVVNNLTLMPTVVPAGIKSSIETALVRNAEIESTRILVTSEHGHVTLSGSVRSWAEHRRAEQTCWSAAGVTRVTNNLTVEVEY